jgi:hypothetical protein
VAEEVPREGQEGQAGASVLQRHPPGRGPQEDPAPDGGAEKAVQEPEGQVIGREPDVHDAGGERRHGVDAAQPGEGATRVAEAEEQPEAGGPRQPGAAEREQQGRQADPGERPPIERRE